MATVANTKHIFTGTAGVYYVMHQLAVRGFHASCTHGNAPYLDILVSSEDGDRMLTIQVKTTEHATRQRGRRKERQPALLDFPLGHKAGRLSKPNVLLAFVDLKILGKEPQVDVYLVPSSFVCNFCRPWIDSVPLVRFQPSNEQMAPFRNAWGQIMAIVGEPPNTETAQKSNA